jgi:uncharacterized protein (TIGR02246 family)
VRRNAPIKGGSAVSWWLVFAVIGIAPACVGPLAAGSVQHGSTSRDSLAIVAVARGIIAADNAKDLTRVLTYYADRALLLPPNEEPVAGRTAIRPRYERLFSQFDPAIEGTIDEVVVAREWGYIRGRNRGVLRPIGGGPNRLVNDIHIMVLSRQAYGPWCISRLIWHAAF